jgi:lysyl-tRNA synthetase class 2
MPDASPWWSPHVHADRRPFLLARGRIAAALRSWFVARDFVEVETAALQVSPGNEAHLHAFPTMLRGPDGSERGLYLRTSPEFACKKLLAAGERRIFDFARVFRNRERGAVHHPEFTMLEWYRVGEPYTAVMQDCADIVAAAVEAAGTGRLIFRGVNIDPSAEPERLTVAEAFMRYADIDLLRSLPGGSPDRDGLRAAAVASGIQSAPDDRWGDVFSRILVERIEPQLGRERIT